MLKDILSEEARGAINKYNAAQKVAKQAYEYLRELKTTSEGLELKLEVSIANTVFAILNKPEPEIVSIDPVKRYHATRRDPPPDFGGATGF